MTTMKTKMKQLRKFGKAFEQACHTDEPEPSKETKTEKNLRKAMDDLYKAEVKYHDNPTRTNERTVVKAEGIKRRAWFADAKAKKAKACEAHHA
jgi:hypothetical protein